MTYRIMVTAYSQDTLTALYRTALALGVSFCNDNNTLVSDRYSGVYWCYCESEQDADALQDLLSEAGVFLVKDRFDF